MPEWIVPGALLLSLVGQGVWVYMCWRWRKIARVWQETCERWQETARGWRETSEHWHQAYRLVRENPHGDDHA